MNATLSVIAADALQHPGLEFEILEKMVLPSDHDSVRAFEPQALERAPLGRLPDVHLVAARLRILHELDVLETAEPADD